MVRKACIDDASRLAEILIFSKRTAYRDIFKNDKISFGEMQVLPLALEFVNNPMSLQNILVFDDEFVKGMVNFNGNINIEKINMIEIKEIYVDPFFQSVGIGSKLLLEVEVISKNKGYSFINLWVLEKNIVGRKFYEKHNFMKTHERKIEDGTAEYVIMYSKQII